MTKQWVDNMIQQIISAENIVANEGYMSLHDSVKATLRTYLVDTNKDKKILVLKPIPGKEHRSKTIIPLEESYDVVQKSHNLTDHGTITEMEAWLENNKILVNSMCPAIYRRLCVKCMPVPAERDIAEQNKAIQMITDQKPEAAGILPIPVKNKSNEKCFLSEDVKDISDDLVNEEVFEHVCSVDILDISKNPDHLFKYLLIHEDRKTNFIQLRPLTANAESEISLELIKIIMDFGPPDCIVVDVENKNIFENILERARILASTNIALALHKSENELIGKVAKNILLWMKDQDCKHWGTGCHVVQWNMNNKPGIDGITPFSRVFGYKSTDLEYKSKFLPALYDNSDEDENIVSLALDQDEEVEGSIDQEEDQLTDSWTVNENSDKEAFLVTMTEDVMKTEEPDLPDNPDNQYDSDED